VANHYYVIGIGGVGSKVMEAVVRMCECGYIHQQDEITCLMIDADANCGNTFQTATLLKDYQNCRERLRPFDEDDKLFRTALKGVGTGDNETFVATPIDETTLTVEDNIVTLASREAYNFMSAAYSKEEYTMNVTDGFYGRPTVGSLVFAWRINESSTINKVINEIGNKTLSDNVYVFLAGSLFGGTGASGLPTIAKAIVGHAANRDNLHLSACLMLPYFKYDGPAQSEIDHRNFAANAQNAINYYKNQMEKDVFNQVYMVGDPEKPIRGAYATKGGEQRNMPHILEMFAAAQAGRFFSTPPASLPSYTATKWYADPYYLQGEELKDLVWRDYSDGVNLQGTIEQFILFNYYFSMHIVPHIFNFIGGAGNFFETRRIEGFDSDEADDMPSWIYGRNGDFGLYRWARRPAAELFRRVRRLDAWQPDISTESFAVLFEYLTKSAKWYLDIISEYNSEHKTCQNCPEALCEGGFDEALRSCTSRVMLPGLLGEGGRGPWMLAKRANMTGWLLKKGNTVGLFKSEAKKFVDGIGENALVNSEEHHVSNFDAMDLGGPPDAAAAFSRLVREVYRVASSI